MPLFASVSSLVIEAAPSNNPDMTFRIAGLVDQSVVVPAGSQVDVEFINADSDEAHALVITATAPPYSLRPAAAPAFAGMSAGPIGNLTSAGHGARDLAFVAGIAGTADTYHYRCPMSGHAEMGMTGLFIVPDVGVTSFGRDQIVRLQGRSVWSGQGPREPAQYEVHIFAGG
jgi:hypothetical protein